MQMVYKEIFFLFDFVIFQLKSIYIANLKPSILVDWLVCGRGRSIQTMMQFVNWNCLAFIFVWWTCDRVKHLKSFSNLSFNTITLVMYLSVKGWNNEQINRRVS